MVVCMGKWLLKSQLVPAGHYWGGVPSFSALKEAWYPLSVGWTKRIFETLRAQLSWTLDLQCQLGVLQPLRAICTSEQSHMRHIWTYTRIQGLETDIIFVWNDVKPQMSCILPSIALLRTTAAHVHSFASAHTWQGLDHTVLCHNPMADL